MSSTPPASSVVLDYQRPVVDPIVLRDGSDLVVRGGSDFSSVCACCGRPAAGRPVRLRCIKPVRLGKPSARGTGGLIEIVLILLWGLLELLFHWLRAQTPGRVIRYGLCGPHRRRRAVFGWATRAALIGGIGVFAFGAWAGGHATGVAHDFSSTMMIAGPLIGLLVAVGFAFHRPGLKVTGASDDSGLFWLKGAGEEFLEGQARLERS